ncbi:FAS1 domain-containing protein [Bombardia bombarda]|uniref:FAS1 domain-containing protein n=1 Tax=Bombardia bombarda TaxID=252184 RepID=A0AA39XL84_9PEZI|nr:FAS1 domain-containing protein [Bombardia bombarda]
MQLLAKHLLALAIHAPILCSAQSLKESLDTQNATLSKLNSFLQSQQAFFNSLSDTKDITVLAPSNEALNLLADDSDMMDKMSADPDLVTAFLEYHVFQGTYYPSNITNAQAPLLVPTLMNGTSFTNVTGGQRVQVVDDDGQLQFLSGSLNQATVQNIPNGQQSFNFSGGTIYIIDRVLAIPANITDTLVSANLTAAAGALKKSKLTADLTQASELTMFAPSNHAFDVVGSALSDMSAADLADVMGYHVVQGKVLYSSLITNTTEKTTEGKDVHLRVEDGKMFVNGARIVQTNILVNNGVVHVIDNLLNPAHADARPDPTAATQAPAFAGATTTGGVPFTSGVGTPTSTTEPFVPATVTSVGGGGGGGDPDAPTVVSGGSKRVVNMTKTEVVRVMVLLGGAALFLNV